MVKVDQNKKSRVVKYTKTYPPVTWSNNGRIPKQLRHHIKGNLAITYKPSYLDDLVNKVTYDLSEDETHLC